jgi:hypothetical protein
MNSIKIEGYHDKPFWLEFQVKSFKFEKALGDKNFTCINQDNKKLIFLDRNITRLRIDDKIYKGIKY